LVLVVAVSKIADYLRNKQPRTLKVHCIVEHFPWSGSISQQLASVPPFKAIAESLCAFHDTNKLESLVSHFAAAWILGTVLSSLMWKTQAFANGIKVTLACSSEDADWLSKGILDELQKLNVLVSLAVFWNLRTDPFGYL